MRNFEKIKKILIQQNLDALLVSSVANIEYLTHFSSFSLEEREAFLLITQDLPYIFTDRRYLEEVSKKIADCALIEVTPKNPMRAAISELLKKLEIKKIGFEENNITVSEFNVLKKTFLSTDKQIQFKPVRQMIEKVRMAKEKEEIDAIEKACKIGDDAFSYILPRIKAGVSEKEIAFEIEFFIKKQGADISFPPIVAFGPHSSIPHHQPITYNLQPNTIVLLDFGVRVNNYCSDMTRTVFFGSATAEYKKMYQTVLTAQQKAIEFISAHCHSEPRFNRGEESRERKRRSFPRLWRDQDDILGKDVDKTARGYITSHGFPSIPHSLGHGIGVQVHESPRLSPTSNELLKPGMVFSIEPGIYITDFGGVRIEDLVVLQKSDIRILTRSPKELITIKD